MWAVASTSPTADIDSVPGSIILLDWGGTCSGDTGTLSPKQTALHPRVKGGGWDDEMEGDVNCKSLMNSATIATESVRAGVVVVALRVGAVWRTLESRVVANRRHAPSAGADVWKSVSSVPYTVCGG